MINGLCRYGAGTDAAFQMHVGVYRRPCYLGDVDVCFNTCKTWGRLPSLYKVIDVQFDEVDGILLQLRMLSSWHVLSMWNLLSQASTWKQLSHT